MKVILLDQPLSRPRSVDSKLVVKEEERERAMNGCDVGGAGWSERQREQRGLSASKL